MEKRTFGWIRPVVLIIGIALIAGILFHAWKTLTTAEKTAGGGKIETEAADEIWVDVVELESNKDVAVALKEAVLGTAQQQKKLVVFEQQISDIIKVTDEGKLPFNWSAKYQYVKYSGTASYTVDLGAINDTQLQVDEEAKTLTIRIPHAVESLDINEEETQSDDTEKIGFFSIGDLKLSEEERSEVIAEVKSNMEEKLKTGKVKENADRMAILSVWEIYQPVVTKVDPSFTVVTEFAGGA